MKHFLLLIALLLSSFTAVLAIPPGSYCDRNGNLKVIVSQSGQEVYHIARDGRVLITLIVVSEIPDSETSTTRVILKTKGLSTESSMHYWTENGIIYLHDGLRKLQRE